MNKSTSVFIIIILFCACQLSTAFAQLKTWQFEDIDSLQKSEQRPVIVFIHTTWCRYCAAMKKTTFKDKTIIDELNQKSYLVFLDAESKKDIVFNKHVFKYKPTGNNTGSNELADHLAMIHGQVAYPTICILNAKNEIIYQLSNYLSPSDFKLILNALRDG